MEESQPIVRTGQWPRLSVAPMMGWTDQHLRSFHRLLTTETKLYTEMISAEEVVSGSDADRARLLRTCQDDGPVAIQMGGSRPDTLAHAISILKAAKTSEWVEINLNCGCPSPRVAHQSDSTFGARLMHNPERVKQCVEAMARVSGSVPITVKCRLGTDEKNGYDRLSSFVRTVSSSGVRHFAVHARECVLEGLNPAQNRSIPPLMPRWVHMLQRDFPEATFAVNGGVKTISMAERHLGLSKDGYGSYEGVAPLSTDASSPPHVVEAWGDLPPVGEVMIGREAFQNPWMLRHADPRLHLKPPPSTAATRGHLLDAYLDIVERRGDGTEYLAMQPLLTLFAGERGGKVWRRNLQEGWKAARGRGDVRAIVEAAREMLPGEVLESV